MSEAKKKNLFDDSDGEEDFKPPEVQPAAEAQQPPVEAPTEASVAPVEEPSSTAEKPSLFDDDDNADYQPPSQPAAETQ